MKQKPRGRASSSEQIIRGIKRKTRKQYGAEEKIRIVLDGLRGEDSKGSKSERTQGAGNGQLEEVNLIGAQKRT